MDELAKRFFGSVARWQLLRQGHSPSRIDNWWRSGRMHLKYPGVYAWGREELSARGQLAAGLLFANWGSALGGLSALWWENLFGDRPDFIHIDAPGYTSSRQDLLIRHPRRSDVHFHEGIPVVDLASSLLTAAPDLEDRDLRIALANADFHKLLHLPSLQSACARGPVGSKRLRAAMGRHLPQLAACRNDFEIDFVLLCEEHGIEIPDPNEPKGNFIPDMTWEKHRLIVELDGKGAHSSPAQKIADRKRQDWLEARGYTVIRFTWAEVYFSPRSVVARLLPHLPR